MNTIKLIFILIIFQSSLIAQKLKLNISKAVPTCYNLVDAYCDTNENGEQGYYIELNWDPSFCDPSSLDFYVLEGDYPNVSLVEIIYNISFGTSIIQLNNVIVGNYYDLQSTQAGGTYSLPNGPQYSPSLPFSINPESCELNLSPWSCCPTSENLLENGSFELPIEDGQIYSDFTFIQYPDIPNQHD